MNHIQVINLDTLQILTAAKSLLEEGVEETYMDLKGIYDARDGELVANEPWPPTYNYFYGGLLMSPDNKRFLSKGWTWGSADAYTVYGVADFIANNRIVSKQIDFWKCRHRPACWVGDNIVVVPYNPKGEDNAEDKQRLSAGDGNAMRLQLRWYNLDLSESAITKRMVFDVFDEMPSELYHSSMHNAIIALHKKKGLACCDMEGVVLLRDEDFKPNAYFPEHNCFITYAGTKVSVHQLV